MRIGSYLLIGWFLIQGGNIFGKGNQPVRVLSFNIRMDTEEDGFNRWSNRKDFVGEMLFFHQPDLIGAQEVLHHQLMDLKERLPEFAAVGVGREDGKEKGEYNAVFYRKDRFKLLEQQTFWLSEDPTAVGKKGWDAACERIVTWVKLKDRETKKVFYFFNTHFDHMGSVARRESCRLLKEKIREIAGDKPVVVTGDFNAGTESSVIAALTDLKDPAHLTDSREIAAFRYGPEFSFHDYGQRQPERLGRIDYIFVKRVREVLQSAVITDTKGALYVSDHYPVLAVIEI